MKDRIVLCSLSRLWLACWLQIISDVTRVGDTRGGNWGCHPSIFFLKTWRPFFAHRCHYHYRFLLLSLGCHPLQGVSIPTPFLPVRSRFSTILCKFAHKIFFLRVSPPEGCHPGLSAPRLPLVTPLQIIERVLIICRYMLCADYEDYIRVQDQVSQTYLVRMSSCWEPTQAWPSPPPSVALQAHSL